MCTKLADVYKTEKGVLVVQSTDSTDTDLSGGKGRGSGSSLHSNIYPRAVRTWGKLVSFVTCAEAGDTGTTLKSTVDESCGGSMRAWGEPLHFGLDTNLHTSTSWSNSANKLIICSFTHQPENTGITRHYG